MACASVGQRKPGDDLFGDGTAANHSAALEHERLQPGLGQVEGSREAVDAGADDNH